MEEESVEEKVPCFYDANLKALEEEEKKIYQDIEKRRKGVTIILGLCTLGVNIMCIMASDGLSIAKLILLLTVENLLMLLIAIVCLVFFKKVNDKKKNNAINEIYVKKLQLQQDEKERQKKEKREKIERKMRGSLSEQKRRHEIVEQVRSDYLFSYKFLELFWALGAEHE